MNADNAHAAGQSGMPPTSSQPLSRRHAAPASEILTPYPGFIGDEVHRQKAVAALANYLQRGGALLEHCETLAGRSRGNRLSPILAAAHLLYANAQVAKVLAQVALVEHRRRTIVETVQPHKPTEAELLAQGIAEAGQRHDSRVELERRLDALLESARAHPDTKAADVQEASTKETGAKEVDAKEAGGSPA
jgi:Predicted protein-tyrosine phosphatase